MMQMKMSIGTHMENDLNPFNIEEEFIDKFMLARILNCSPRTIERHSHNIAGYTKIGSLVRYHAPTVYRALLSGKNIFENPSRAKQKPQQRKARRIFSFR